MYRVFLCLLPVSLFATACSSLDLMLQKGEYEVVYNETSTLLQVEHTPKKQMEALFTQALSLFFLDDYSAAYNDLMQIEEIASSISVTEFTSKDFRSIFTEFAWFRLGFAAAQKNKHDMFRCLEVIKIVDDSFPKIYAYENYVQIFPKTNQKKIYSFIEMLVGLQAISHPNQVSYNQKFISIRYSDSLFIPKPSNYLKKIEIAAGRCFCSSQWADVSWEFIGKNVNSSCIWTYFGFGDWHHELLKKIERAEASRLFP